MFGPAATLRATTCRSRAVRARPREQATATLAKLRASLYWQLEQGAESVLFEIPTARDGAREGRESVTIKVKIDGRKYVRTVYVAG